MSHWLTLWFFLQDIHSPKQCLYDISSNQITCLLPGTHKLFHKLLFDIPTPLLSTPSVFSQMVVFSFQKLIFDIASALSLDSSQLPFSFKLMMVISRTSANNSNPWNYQILLVSGFLIPPSRLRFVALSTKLSF